MKLITEGMTANEAIGWLDTMKRRNEPQRIEPVPHDSQREAYLRKRCTCGAGFADACCPNCWPV